MKLEETMCRMTIFILCAQVLVHLRPNKSYEKYLKMLVSMMILLQLILPVISLLGDVDQESFEVRFDWFEEQINGYRQESIEKSLETERMPEQNVQETVEKEPISVPISNVQPIHIGGDGE